jgi:tetratricopeptide (TPR) repeat protein
VTCLFLAQLYRSQGNLEAAQDELAKALAINTSLIALDPQKGETLRDEALILQEQGVEQRIAKRYDAAAASINRSLALFTQLAAKDPTDAKLLVIQADAYAESAGIAELRERKSDAKADWAHVRNILAGLQDRKLLREADARKLDLARRKLSS